MARVPQPQQPFLHDLVGQVAAPTQVWSARDGQVLPRADGAAGVVGLLHGDVRLLSGVEVSVDDEPGVPVAHRQRADGSVVFTSLLRGLDAAHAGTGDPHVRLDRERTVTPGRLVEELTLGSTLDVAVDVEVAVRLTPDASPMDVVRTGRPRVAVAPAADGHGWSADGVDVTLGPRAPPGRAPRTTWLSPGGSRSRPGRRWRCAGRPTSSTPTRRWWRLRRTSRPGRSCCPRASTSGWDRGSSVPWPTWRA